MEENKSIYILEGLMYALWLLKDTNDVKIAIKRMKIVISNFKRDV